MFKNILVATDGCQRSESAVAKSLQLATEHGATVHVLYVIDRRPAEPILRALRKETGRKATVAVAARATRLGLDVVSHVTVGIPSKQILAYAADHPIDLIVMGGRNRSRLEQLVIPSVAQRVIRTAQLPVLVIRESVTPTQSQPAPISAESGPVRS